MLVYDLKKSVQLLVVKITNACILCYFSVKLFFSFAKTFLFFSQSDLSFLETFNIIPEMYMQAVILSKTNLQNLSM